jgi:hypothetical protein
MVYRDQFVASIRCNGKILREDKDLVTLPFGSSFEILLKNISTRKVQVKISIDGKDVLDGNSIVVFPNSDHEIHGFLKGLNVTNKFKFIQKTNEISEHRGDRLDDGIVRIEYAFEKEVITKTILHEQHVTHTYTQYPWWNNTNINYQSIEIPSVYVSASAGNVSLYSTLTNSNATRSLTSGSSNTVGVCINSFNNNADEGITVKGEETNQRFVSVIIGELEDSKVIVIRLKGTNDKGGIIAKPINVNEKITCETCGRSQDSINKFCGNCGTSLR